jgi:hypothetical protein
MTKTDLWVRSLDNSHRRNAHTHNILKDKCMQNRCTHVERMQSQQMPTLTVTATTEGIKK